MSRCTVLFGTRLWRTDLCHHGVITPKVNLEMARAVRQAFVRSCSMPLSRNVAAQYRHEGANRSHEADPLASAANNEFFQHQISNLQALDTTAAGTALAGDDCMLSSFSAGASAGAFAQLACAMRSSAARFFVEACALPSAQAEALIAGRRLLMWASVHSDGSAHPYHSHRDALLSGVYFADCPEGAGDFIAGSAMPPDPLSVEYRVAPSTGTLLIFPSNLPHRVAPSTSKPSRPRVSISFNLEGAWDESPPPPHVQLTDKLLDPHQPEARRRLIATLEPAEHASGAHLANSPRRGVCVSQQGVGTSGARQDLNGAQIVPDTVAEDEAMASFAEMAQKLMRNQDSKPGEAYGKRPQGMPERRKRQ